MNSNFEMLQKIIYQVYAKNFSCLFHVELRNLPRCPKPGPRWSDPFVSFLEGCKVSFSVMINSFISIENFYLVEKQKQRKFREKNSLIQESWKHVMSLTYSGENTQIILIDCSCVQDTKWFRRHVNFVLGRNKVGAF